MSNILDITRYSFSNQDSLLLDANVWLYLYYPQDPADWKVRTYSKVYQRMLQANSKIYMDALILSEIINRIARIECQAQNFSNFKLFRNSPTFPAKDIAAIARQILKNCERIESGFIDIDIQLLLNRYETIPSDFNDLMLINLCQKLDLCFVTNDGDFKGYSAKILTANRKLLKP